MHRERKLSALRRCLPGETQGWGAEISFFCPFPKPKGCGGEHHRPKLAVNLDSDFWHCWVCGQGGRNLLRLLSFGGKEHPDYIEYAAEVETARPKAEVAKEYERVRLPKEFRPLCVDFGTPYYHQAIAYLSGRGITSDDILTYKLGYAEEGRYKERIIVPSFDEYGELNFFVGRALWPRVGLPYLSGKFDKDIIFNDLLVDWSRPITLVEGPFDAIKAGTNAVALQGKYVSDRLLNRILEKKARVYIALDIDAASDIVKLAAGLLGYGIEVHIVEWKGFKDPGEMTQEQFAGFHRAAKRFGSVEVMKYRVMHSGTMGRA